MVPLLTHPATHTANITHKITVKNWAHPAAHFPTIAHFLIHWVFILHNPLCGFELSVNPPTRLLASYQEITQ